MPQMNPRQVAHGQLRVSKLECHDSSPLQTMAVQNSLPKLSQLNPALSNPNARSAEPGAVRIATFIRFHPLIAMTA
jgi:hypothetical protein